VIALDNHGVRWADFTPLTRMAACALGLLKDRASFDQARRTRRRLAAFTGTAVLTVFLRSAVILGAYPQLPSGLQATGPRLSISRASEKVYDPPSSPPTMCAPSVATRQFTISSASAVVTCAPWASIIFCTIPFQTARENDGWPVI
jgi:hypothetical protein